MAWRLLSKNLLQRTWTKLSKFLLFYSLWEGKKHLSNSNKVQVAIIQNRAWKLMIITKGLLSFFSLWTSIVSWGSSAEKNRLLVLYSGLCVKKTVLAVDCQSFLPLFTENRTNVWQRLSNFIRKIIGNKTIAHCHFLSLLYLYVLKNCWEWLKL